MTFFKQLLQGFVCLLTISACAQKTEDPCEGCEAIYENHLAFQQLPYMDTMPGFNDGVTKIFINGKVLKADEKTPAAGIILYLYQTDETGIYPTKGDEKGWGRRHGYLRTWLKTNKDGEYMLYTIKPGAYPNSNNPQHIHIIVKEPGKTEYWLDDFHFDDDTLLNTAVRKSFQNRGGNGIITLQKEGAVYKGRRDIILGKNIPGY